MINSISSWARVCFSHRPARPAIADTPEGICQLDNPNEARGTAQRHQGPDVAEPRLAPLRWFAIPPDIAPPWRNLMAHQLLGSSARKLPQTGINF